MNRVIIRIVWISTITDSKNSFSGITYGPHDIEKSQGFACLLIKLTAKLILVLLHPPDPALTAYGPISFSLHVVHFDGPGGGAAVVVVFVVGDGVSGGASVLCVVDTLVVGGEVSGLDMVVVDTLVVFLGSSKLSWNK